MLSGRRRGASVTGLRWLRHELAARAAARDPAELAIGELGSDRVLTADVRAGTEQSAGDLAGPRRFQVAGHADRR